MFAKGEHQNLIIIDDFTLCFSLGNGTLICYIYIFIAIALNESIFLDVVHLRNEFHFSVFMEL